MVGGINLQSFSHGSLSHAKSTRHSLSLESLRRAQILCVDEGHNFLNFKSNRTQHLLRNMADHMLLFTATPINRLSNTFSPAFIRLASPIQTRRRSQTKQYETAGIAKSQNLVSLKSR